MGKSIELLGLAAFNVFIALILCATFLSGNGGGKDRVETLTEDNVAIFIAEVSDVAAGKKQQMDGFGITEYLMTHIADHGVFKSTISFTMPDAPASSRELEMDKMNFISHTLQGMKTMEKRETVVKIDYIQIADNGKTASVTTTNRERGVMPVDDGSGEMKKIPVEGTSYCEQKLELSDKKIIQMAEAKCSTSIDFANSY